MVKTVSNIGSSTDKDGDEGEFIFNLEIFNDEDMTSPIDDDHVTSVGDNLYFKLSQEHPVNGLIFSIDGSFLSVHNLTESLIHSRLHCERSRIRTSIFNCQRSMSKRFC